MFVPIFLALGMVVGAGHAPASAVAVRPATSLRTAAPPASSGGGIGAAKAAALASGGGIGATKASVVNSGGGIGALKAAILNSGGGIGALLGVRL